MPHSQQRFHDTSQILQQGRVEKLHHGVQLYVSRDGETLIDTAVGDAASNVPMLPDSLTLWLSAGKPITAVAVMKLIDEERLSLATPVAEIIPEFAQGGKEEITLEQLLTHTSGFRYLSTGYPKVGWNKIIERICQMKLEQNWVPGKKAGYHHETNWFILGEILQRVHQADFPEIISREVFQPMGMIDSTAGMTSDEYQKKKDCLSTIFIRLNDKLRERNWHHEQFCTSPSPPGLSLRGPVRELGYFYEMLLGKGERAGVRILSEEAATLMCSRRREGLYDYTLEHTVDYGLGISINSNRYGIDTVPYGFGKHCSETTFGHGGAQATMGMADPEHGLVITYATNGMAGEERHQRRNRKILESIYKSLGLTS